MKPKESVVQPSPQPARREEKAIIKPKGKYPERKSAGRVQSDSTPRDATGINAQDMFPVDPDSPYIPPA